MSLDNLRVFGAGAKHGRSNSSPKHLAKGSSLPRSPTIPTTKDSPGLRPDKSSPAGGATHEAKENILTPVDDILSPNVTPRSDSRKARVGSASPTTNVLPRVARLSTKSTDVRHRSSADTGPIAGFNPSEFVNGGNGQVDWLSSNLPSSTRFESALPERESSTTTRSVGLGSAKFFHADDVHEAAVSVAQPSKKLLEPRSPDLKKLGGTTEMANLAASRSDLPRAGQTPKFFYANDVPDQQASTPQPSSLTSASNLPAQSMYSPVLVPSPPRAPSPLKEVMRSRRSSGSQSAGKKLGRLSSPDGVDVKSLENAAPGSNKLSRPSSLVSSRKQSLSERTISSSINQHGPVSTSSVGSIQGSQMRVLLDGNEKHSPLRSSTFEAKDEPLAAPLSPSGPQSPTKSQNTIDHTNDFAANARRERKVLDLEISNSSLLAINRALEREMRKQTAELRRLRRLTQSSRFSTSLSARSTSGSLEAAAELENGLYFDDPASPSESDEDKPDDSLSNNSSTRASSLCSSLPGHGASSRFQDPKREPLDLSAQKTLLMESRKLSESINRCLNQTDTLIKAGKEALERQAQASDLETLGLRMKTSDEDEDDSNFEHGKGLLSPFKFPDKDGNPWEDTLNGFFNNVDEPLISEASKADTESDSESPPQHDEDRTLRLVTTEDIGAISVPLSPTNGEEDQTATASPSHSGSLPSVKHLDQAVTIPPVSVESMDAKVHNLVPNDPGLVGPGQSDSNTATQEESENYEPSIDGLDEDLRASITERPKTPPASQFFVKTSSPNRRAGDAQESNPSSPQRQNMNAAANTPGNRSSMKTLGHFFGLESMSILGIKGT